MMYYALTIKDSIITGVHESAKPITDKTFAKSHTLAEHAVMPVKSPMEYQYGQDIRAYDKSGMLMPLDWRIANGYAETPPPSLEDEIKALKKRLADAEGKVTIMESDIGTLKAGKVEKAL